MIHALDIDKARGIGGHTNTPELARIRVTGRLAQTFSDPIDGPWAATIHNQYHYNGRLAWRFDRDAYTSLAMNLRWRNVR